MKAKKTPLGLTPRCIRNAERLDEINSAISRYVNSDYQLPIPNEWLDERNELIEKLKLLNNE